MRRQILPSASAASALSPIPGPRYLKPNVRIGVEAKSMVIIAVSVPANVGAIRPDIRAIGAGIWIRPDEKGLGECRRGCRDKVRAPGGGPRAAHPQASNVPLMMFVISTSLSGFRCLGQGRCLRQYIINPPAVI